MKLYAWQPKGHGEMSFFVMAENEEAAKQAVEKKMQECLEEEDSCYGRVHFEGWGTDYYLLSVVNSGVVLLNSND